MSHFELGSPWLAKKKLFRKLAVMPHLVHLGLPPDVSHFSTVTLKYVELYKSIMHKRAQNQAILTLNYVVRMSNSLYDQSEEATFDLLETRRVLAPLLLPFWT